MAYTYRPYLYDPIGFSPFGYWGDSTTSSTIVLFSKDIIFNYVEDRILEFTYDDNIERVIDFIYTEDRILEFPVSFSEEGGANMARVFRTEKQPNEYITCNIDFTDRLGTFDGTAEIITAVSVDATSEDGTSVWTTVLTGGSSVATDGKSVNVGIKGGVSGYLYHLNILCTLNTSLPNTTDYEKLEADLYLTVRDL